jgi:formylglycine-generating enzyme required for sulfatase activity
MEFVRDKWLMLNPRVLIQSRVYRIVLSALFITLSVSCNQNGGTQKATSTTLNEEAQKAAAMIQPSQIGAEMVLINTGPFLMGSNDLSRAERPAHRVDLDAFYIGKFEVTNGQFKAFCDATRRPYPEAEWSPDGETSLSSFKEQSAYPVVGINWEDALAYCQWLSQQTGKKYRLPTEAEWEKAARGGLEGQNYPWGNEEFDSGGRYRANCGSESDNDRIRKKDGFLNTSPIGTFPPNGYGLYDMAGNVWEWCADYYDENYYASSPEKNPPGPSTGEKRSLRGGSWFGGPQRMRCAARLWNYPLIRYASTGFRIAMTP